MSLSSNFPAIRPSLLLDFQKSRAVDPRITFTRASTATYFDEDGILQSALANVPRIDFNPSTLVCNGLLIEEQRTNSIRNNTMQGAVAGTPGTVPTNWVITGTSDGLTREIVGTGVENGITYVDVKYSGTTTASSTKIIAFEAANHIVASSGQTWTASAYVKIASGSLVNVTSVNILTQGRDSGNTTFTETFTTPFTPSATLTRFVAASTLANASTAFVRTSVNFTYLINTAIDITLRIGLPQLELGAFATSVIPTTTTALTRNADVASMTGTNFSSWYNASEGTVVVDFVLRQLSTPSIQSLTSINDTTANNRWTIAVGTTNFGVTLRNTSGAGLLQTSTSNTAVVGENKLALAISTGASIVLNGGTVATTATYAAPVVTQMQIGNQLGGGFLNGTIRRIAYYPVRLANTTLQALTG